MSKKTVIDETAFNRMLSWLNPDREQAAHKYEAVRRRLIAIFASRRFPDAERMADETIDRVVSKVPQVADGWVGDPLYYFLAVAKKMILEASKPTPHVFRPPEPDALQLEREDLCLEKCLGLIPVEDRDLILKYVGGDKHRRQELARELGITANALRIRVHQIKKIIRRCVGACLEQEGS